MVRAPPAAVAWRARREVQVLGEHADPMSGSTVRDPGRDLPGRAARGRRPCAFDGREGEAQRGSRNPEGRVRRARHVIGHLMRHVMRRDAQETWGMGRRSLQALLLLFLSVATPRPRPPTRCQGQHGFSKRAYCPARPGAERDWAKLGSASYHGSLQAVA